MHHFQTLANYKMTSHTALHARVHDYKHNGRNKNAVWQRGMRIVGNLMEVGKGREGAEVESEMEEGNVGLGGWRRLQWGWDVWGQVQC